MRLFRRGETASTLDLLVAGLGNPGREHAPDRQHPGRGGGGGAGRRRRGGAGAVTRRATYSPPPGPRGAPPPRFFKVPPEALVVVHDDVDLEPGRLQVRLGGGLAGHNGLRSIAPALGTQEV